MVFFWLLPSHLNVHVRDPQRRATITPKSSIWFCHNQCFYFPFLFLVTQHVFSPSALLLHLNCTPIFLYFCNLYYSHSCYACCVVSLKSSNILYIRHWRGWILCCHIHSCFHILCLAPAPWIGFLTKWASTVLSLLIQNQLHQYQPLRLRLNQRSSPEHEPALQSIFWPYLFTILRFTLQSDPRVQEWVFHQMKQSCRIMFQVCLVYPDLLMGLLITGPACSWSGENSRCKIHRVWTPAPQNQLFSFPDLYLFCWWCWHFLNVHSEELIFLCHGKRLFVVTSEICLCHIRGVWDYKP